MNTKDLLEDLFLAALKAVNPESLIEENCRLNGSVFSVQEKSFDLSQYGRVFILGSGKAAWSMASVLEKMIRPFLHSGLIVVPECKGELKDIECMESDHPIPTERSMEGAKSLIKKITECQEGDLYIYLLSGGSSSLIELPVEGISLGDLQEATDLMLKNGLKINEINSVRKHLSLIKGGRLGEYSQAEGIVLTISDVIGDDLYSIGSAPLYADISTYQDVVDILERYEIMEKMPKQVAHVLKEGLEGRMAETPKTPSSRIKHFVVGNNAMAKEAIYKKTLELGLNAKLVEEEISSDVEVASQQMLEYAMTSQETLLIFGGETTVKVMGGGKGGRNQHAALYMLKLAHDEGVKVGFISAGTDGVDGNSDAAGAVIDSHTFQQAKEMGLNPDIYLKENDSYHFFKQLDSLVMTGPTGCNVMDISILIKES